MPTYVVLINWTDQGIREAKDTLAQDDRFAEVVDNLGARVEYLYWTVGSYDIVAIIEAPDDESVSAITLATGSAGSVRTTTLRGYDREEMSGIIERL